MRRRTNTHLSCWQTPVAADISQRERDPAHSGHHHRKVRTCQLNAKTLKEHVTVCFHLLPFLQGSKVLCFVCRRHLRARGGPGGRVAVERQQLRRGAAAQEPRAPPRPRRSHRARPRTHVPGAAKNAVRWRIRVGRQAPCPRRNIVLIPTSHDFARDGTSNFHSSC